MNARASNHYAPQLRLLRLPAFFATIIDRKRQKAIVRWPFRTRNESFEFGEHVDQKEISS